MAAERGHAIVTGGAKGIGRGIAGALLAAGHALSVSDVDAGPSPGCARPTPVRRVFEGRVVFHDGDAVLLPGLSLHRIGGHTAGLQVVRVNTRRGVMVLASDASHFHANMREGRPYPVVFHIGEMVEGWRRLAELADSPDPVIPGHDPLVLARHAPAAPGLEGWIARLDLDPPA